MKRRITLMSRFYRARSFWHKRHRLLFPSPAEIRLIRVMGGRALTLPFIKATKTGFSLTLVLSMGRVFKNERVKREVRVGSKYIDFGNDIQRGIEVDGRQYHGDIVLQVERDEYFAQRDWRVLHVDAVDIWRRPVWLRKRVLSFLNR